MLKHYHPQTIKAHERTNSAQQYYPARFLHFVHEPLISYAEREYVLDENKRQEI